MKEKKTKRLYDAKKIKKNKEYTEADCVYLYKEVRKEIFGKER